jgi:hypothetical protein
MDAASWVAAHVAAFGFFSGAPRRLVPDNLANGVDRPDVYDPKINRAYGELAAHYGCLVDPARVRRPTDKPNVERPMPYVRDSLWRGREWRDVTDMQTGALAWCTEVAGVRHVRTIDGAQPFPLFVEHEAPLLIPLPPQDFELAAWSRPKVGPDCHVRVGRALYSVPWRLIGAHVDARDNGRTIEVFADGVVVKTWARIERGKQTDWADYPPEKVAFFMRTPTWCRRRAAELGPFVAEVVGQLLEVNALHRLRSAQGVIGLADNHGENRLDAACARALAVGDPSCRTVKGVLAAGTEHDDPEASAAVDAPAHLHGRARLFAIDTGEAS